MQALVSAVITFTATYLALCSHELAVQLCILHSQVCQPTDIGHRLSCFQFGEDDILQDSI